MHTYSTLIVLSILVIFSYLFDLFAKRTKFPSVLLLLALGAGLRFLTELLSIELPRLHILLPMLGNVGLILIVLEGAMELQFHMSKVKLIQKSFMSALVIMLFSTFSISVFFFYLTHQPYYNCVLNAIPYTVISSAIAIPSVSFLGVEKKEFVVFESSFSDILGVMFFNYTLVNPTFSVASIFALSSETVMLLLLSGGFCLLLMYLMGRITHRIKFFLVISIMILTYAVGKKYHLSTLITVLVFGFFLANQHLIKWPFYKKNFQYKNFDQDFEQLEMLSAESAFLVRTFFFLLFGFTINPETLMDMEVVKYGLGIMGIIFLSRFIYLKFVAKIPLSPELFVNPRGLISILLVMSIPKPLLLGPWSDGLLLFVILGTCLVMVTGVLSYRKA